MRMCYSDLNNPRTHNSATVSQKQRLCQEKWIFLRSAVSFAQTISNTHIQKKKEKNQVYMKIYFSKRLSALLILDGGRKKCESALSSAHLCFNQ